MPTRTLGLLALFVVLLSIQPTLAQPGPGFTDCNPVLLAEFQRWDDEHATTHLRRAFRQT